MNFQYVDTHCHVDLFDDPFSILKQIERTKTLTVAVTNLPSHFRQGMPHLKGQRLVRPALGLHPLLAEQHTEQEREEFLRLLNVTAYIGEVGLDFSREGKSTRIKQEDSFRFVLDAVTDEPRIMTLHSRGADKEVLQLLRQYAIRGAIFHWYSGPIGLIPEVAEAGYYFSVNPAMVRSQRGRDRIAKMPRRSVLTESDGPHIRSAGGTPVGPSDIGSVVEFLAGEWGESADAARSQLLRNFARSVAVL